MKKKLPMNAHTTHHKHYSSAKQRMLKSQIEHFFAEQFPKLFGPVIRGHIAESLLELFARQVRNAAHLEPGQMLWNAVDIAAQTESTSGRVMRVVRTVISEQDIELRSQGVTLKQIQGQATARILRETYQQGGLLSMRDISLLTWHCYTSPTRWRTHYEQTHECELPHPGNLQDMGSCVTHKEQIVYKAIVEKKDPVQVANESKHTQKAVDRYLKDFHRVQTVYAHNPDPSHISMITNISNAVVNQYITLIEKYELNN
jgi:hypothetical protein